MLLSWSASGTQAATDLWNLLGWIGPLLVAVLLAVFIVRAVSRQRRYQALGVLGEEDQRAVREAVREAELKTVGEILPVVVERSDPHPAADWLSALCFLLFGTALFAPWMPWHHPFGVIVAQLLMGAVGFGVARALPDFKRLFIFEDRASKVAEEQAFQEFYGHGLHKTEAATGVLIFVSLLEHRVVILADEGIDARVDAEFWSDTDDAILDGIRRGSLRTGLVDGVRRAGERLGQHYPWREGDRNEVPDRVVVRRE